VVAVDEETFKEAIDIGFGRNKVVVISNGVVLNQIPPVEIAKEIPKDGIFLFLGRIVPGKRVSDVVEAYSICKKKGVDVPGLAIVGGGETEYLKTITRELLIQDHVSILGLQKDVEQFLSRAVCMVNPSESEGFSNSVLEACAFGVPSILSDIPVHRIIAKHIDMEQFLFSVGDVTQLAEKIMQFLSLNAEEVREKRTRCAIFAQKYSKSTRNRAYVDLYEKLIKESQMLKSYSHQ
jgi:glycosyltransferase involved in cell wall biosynthesis